MKIGIDARCLAEGRRTGIEEYTLGLLREIFQQDKKNDYVLFLNSFRKDNADLSWTRKFKNVRIAKFSFPNKLLNLSLWYLGRPYLDQLIGGVDVFFMPNLTFAAISKSAKLVLTIHDLSFERHPETFSWKRRLWHVFVDPKQLVKRADHLITVSESTRQDLLSIYGRGVQDGKITVIPNGLSPQLKVIDRNDEKLVQVKERLGLPYRFILFLGTIEPRKNIIGIIKAFEQLRKYARETGNEDLQKYHLVIAGYPGWSGGRIYAAIERSGEKNMIHLVHSLADQEKAYVLNLATVFVYPSLFEGFGFPPLEAMKCGVPVITSNNSSLPEVVGDAAIMIDPERADEIFVALKEMLSSPDLRRSFIVRGLKQAEKFSWKLAARVFLRGIERLSK